MDGALQLPLVFADAVPVTRESGPVIATLQPLSVATTHSQLISGGDCDFGDFEAFEKMVAAASAAAPAPALFVFLSRSGLRGDARRLPASK